MGMYLLRGALRHNRREPEYIMKRQKAVSQMIRPSDMWDKKLYIDKKHDMIQNSNGNIKYRKRSIDQKGAL